jgi:hypothetical protein
MEGGKHQQQHQDDCKDGKQKDTIDDSSREQSGKQGGDKQGDKHGGNKQGGNKQDGSKQGGNKQGGSKRTKPMPQLPGRPPVPPLPQSPSTMDMDAALSVMAAMTMQMRSGGAVDVPEAEVFPAHEYHEFHEEFDELGTWPPGCKAAGGLQLLADIYAEGRPKTVEFLLRFSPRIALEDANFLTARMGSVPGRVAWWEKAGLGDVHVWEGVLGRYDSSQFESFCTPAPELQLEMLPGGTHVAVGCVDLSSLLMCSPSVTPTKSAPIRWVGYEVSTYNIAKTLVLTHMLQQGASTDDILLVWYSSTWTKKADRAFRAAATSALASLTGSGYLAGTGSGVYLRHWLNTSVSLADARKAWIGSASKTVPCCYSFSYRVDRLALCAYVVSGDLGLPGCTLASTCMFSNPMGFMSLANPTPISRRPAESFLEAVPQHELYAERRRGADDVVAAGVAVLRRKLERLQVTDAGPACPVHLELPHHQDNLVGSLWK